MRPYLKAFTVISLALSVPVVGNSYAQEKNVLEVKELYDVKKTAAVNTPKATPSKSPIKVSPTSTPSKSPLKINPTPAPSKTPVKVNPSPVASKAPVIKVTSTPVPSVVATPIPTAAPTIIPSATPIPSPKEERNPDEVDVSTYIYINRLEAYSYLLSLVIKSDCAKSPDSCNNKETLNKVAKKLNENIKAKYPLVKDIPEEQITSMLINAVTLKDKIGEDNSAKIAKIEEDLKTINESLFKEKKDEIIKIGLASTNTTIPVGQQVNSSPQPSPSSETNPFQNGKVVFVSERDSNPEIYTMSPEGASQTRLTENSGFDIMPAWSADSSKIVFVSDRDGNPEIYTMNSDGSNIIRLTNHSSYDYSPDWSPDGSKILFVSNRGESNANGAVNKISFKIFIMDVDGNNQIKLSDTSFDDESPKWSPDGSKIAFVSKRDGNPEIYTMNSDGTNVRRLTNSPTFDIMPAWSPDGSKIAFRSDRDGNPEIYTMNSDGTNLKRVTRNLSSDESPAWSPDGSKLLFVSRRDNIKDSEGDFVNEIYMMNADSSNIARLTKNQADDYSPSWSKN